METRCLQTERRSLVLCPISLADVPGHFALVQANAEHLTRFGDYKGDVAMTLTEWMEHFAEPEARDGLFRIVKEGVPVGLIHLVPVDPPRYGLGYWLAESATGRGYATAAVRAIVAYAREQRGATDVFAGVTHGNEKSGAVLSRCGFRPVAAFETYTRWHRWVGNERE